MHAKEEIHIALFFFYPYSVNDRYISYFYILGEMIIRSLLYLLIIINCVVADVEQFSTLFSSNINVSTSCQAAIHKLSMLAVSEPQLIADYWDSWGKPSHGILKGHTAFLGYYDECINLKNTAVGDTKFCIYAVKMNVNHLHTPSSQQDEVCLTSDCSTVKNTTNSVDIKIGVCYPSACSPNEFGIILSQMDISSVNTIISNPFSNETNTVSIELSNVDDSATFCPQTDVEYDTGTVAVTVICGVLVGLVVMGTLADMICLSEKDTETVQVSSKDSTKKLDEHSPTSGHGGTKHQQPTVKSFLLSFSLYNTVPTLLSTKQSPAAVRGIAGIKIYSNFLIIILHVLFFFLHYQPLASQNSLQYIFQAFPRFILQPVFNVSLTVDTFFLLSATLSAYLTLRDIEKYKRFRFAHFYLNRYFRLSILCYFYTLIAMKLFVHLGDGPVWYQPDYNACSENWWYNILYLSHTILGVDICVAMTWHVSVDMVLYIFSPIFILPLYYAPYIGLFIVFITMIGATAYVGIISASRGFVGAVILSPTDEQFGTLYSRPFFRINPYLVGILLGYILYRNYNNRQKSVHLGKWLKLMMWSIALFLYSASVFGIYGDLSGIHRFNDFENVSYLMFSGLALSIAISIVIYLCNTGHGGVMNSFLSWPGWEPLVKLSYSVFLVHLMVLYFVFGTLQSSLILTDTVMVVLVVAVLVICYGVSAVVAVFVEIPIANVVSLCFKLAGMEARDK